MKKVALFITLLLVLVLTPLVGADFGPKRSLTIEFTGDASGKYVTILSKDEVNGPHIGYEEDNETLEEFKSRIAKDISFDTFMAFFNYTSDYYLIYDIIDISSTNKYTVSYYPPEDFKLLIYDTLNDIFNISDSYNLYAFSTYYLVNLNSNNLVLKNNYDYAKEIALLVVRIIITILIEVLIALLFRIKTKRNYLIILLTNIITQVILNVGLNIWIYFNSFFIYEMFIYLALEIAIFIMEGVVYSLTLKDTSKLKIWVYALIANLFSFGCGLVFYLYLM